METTITKILEIGFPGAVIVGMGFYIIMIEKKHDRLNDVHRTERDEWRGQAKDQFDKIVEVTEKNTSVVSELKGIIQNTKR